MKKPKVSAIILMGGEGVRFGSPLPKQLHRVGGQPVFIHTLKQFLRLNIWDRIILPTPLKWHEVVKKELESLKTHIPISVIAGGSTRQESSYLSLLSCPLDTEYVVIHDAVRPFVSPSILQDNIDGAISHLAVDTCIPSADTLIHSVKGEFIDTIPNRQEFLRGQTPQSFSFPLIMKAHKTAIEDKVKNSSDDCSLVTRMQLPVKIIKGSEYNIKITTELDLFLAERLLYNTLEDAPLSEKNNLEGKTFAVTGATGDIGKALCERLIELGATPISISKTAETFSANLTNYEETEALFETIHAKYGPLDGIINSIGTFEVKDFSLLSKTEIDETIASNLTSVIYCCKCTKLKEGAHIINISSSSYSKGRGEYPIYSASKAAVVNFTQALAETRQDLKVNVIVPQRTKSALREKNFPKENPALLLNPKEVADTITNLLSTSALTGSIVEVRKKQLP
jgi:ribitol-5-phosphate 2-dehydrogenase (NADP+) / D-ribitol-5-phosphate cytidylyltransferase